MYVKPLLFKCKVMIEPCKLRNTYMTSGMFIALKGKFYGPEVTFIII